MDFVCDSIAKTIGPLVSRPDLRTLAIRIEHYQYYHGTVNQSIIKLLECPVGKPILERLILSSTVPLSSIYELVNENYNLKSLTLYMKIESRSREDLIRIFNCNNGLEEIELRSLSLHQGDRSHMRNGKISDSKYNRSIS